MIVAGNDAVTFPEIQLDVYAAAREPKRLVVHPGGHFDTYLDHFEPTSDAAATWVSQTPRLTSAPQPPLGGGPGQLTAPTTTTITTTTDRTTAMPMCDAYIPTGALEPDAERTLIAKITDILVSHEVRRIFQLMDDPQEVEASTERARSIAWTFVHRCDTYVAGAAPDTPYYRFIASVPEGQLDDEFIPAVNRDILAAVQEAEAGRWPDTGSRVWIFTREVPDGTWGAHGLALHLKEIIDFVSPGWGHVAADRFHKQQTADAGALVNLAAAQQVSA